MTPVFLGQVNEGSEGVVTPGAWLFGRLERGRQLGAPVPLFRSVAGSSFSPGGRGFLRPTGKKKSARVATICGTKSGTQWGAKAGTQMGARVGTQMGATHRSERTQNRCAEVGLAPIRGPKVAPIRGPPLVPIQGPGLDPGFCRQEGADFAASRPASGEPAIHRNMAGFALNCPLPPNPATPSNHAAPPNPWYNPF